VSVNSSACQFTDPQLVLLVARTLRDSSLDGTVLELELTGSIVKTALPRWACSKRFLIDTLGIDRSFTQRLNGNNNDSAIVRAIVSLAHTLNMQVTGEGIETADQLCHLRTLGCQYEQGYYFATSQPCDAVTALLAAPAPALHNGTPTIVTSA